jgi:hypothetical protein
VKVPRAVRNRRQETLEAVCRENSLPLIPYGDMTRYAGEFGELTEEARAAA